MGMRGPAIEVVLVKPQDPRNVGAVCRAMKTMGVRGLRIVGAPVLDRETAAMTAVHARDLLDRAVTFPDLPGAVRDAALVAGVTRRRGKRRKYLSLTPEQFADRVAQLGSGTVAVVFGNEASGLSDEELSACHVAVHIPSSPEFPSLNLSHAVQVVAYQLYRRLEAPAGRGRFRPIAQGKLDQLLSEALDALEHIGFFSQGSRAEMGVFLRDILARSALARREAERVAVIFRKIDGLFLRARARGGSAGSRGTARSRGPAGSAGNS
jgi:tRNA/rRNA methyltransferase